MMQSKTVWTGIAMVALGVVKMVFPDVVSFIDADPSVVIGNGFALIFLRLGISKNGVGK